MDFAELKKKIDSEISLEKPDFVKDNADLVNTGHLELNATQKLVFSISNYRNRKYVDIRTWFQDQTGEWKPTKKGIHFSTDKFSTFEKQIAALSEIVALDEE